jgi:hypothetical protein
LSGGYLADEQSDGSLISVRVGGRKDLACDYLGSHNKFSMIFPLLRPKPMAKLPPLCSPCCSPLLTLRSPLLPERSPSLTVDPPPAPICPSTLDDGTHFGSRGFPFARLYSNNHLRSKLGSLRGARLGTMLPFFPSIRGCGGAFLSYLL